jgi:hypothetical protein
MADSIDLLNERPDCPGCGGPMMLSHAVPHRDGIERRTFECRACGKAESYLFELAPVMSRPSPTMWRP